MAGNEQQQPSKPQSQKPQLRREDGIIYIGNKPVMAYVLAVVTQFNNGSGDVGVKARGRAISRAVDVVEVVRRKFITQAKLGAINIGTEHLTGERGEVDVSTIEIRLTK